MKPWVFMLVLIAYPATARTQSITVGYRQTISVPSPGALAAFSLDDFYAEAKAQNETLTIFGKNPGLAHIVAVVRDGTKTFDVRVLAAPAAYPPGFVQPLSASAASENGSFESRYTSGPSQSENIIDFMRREGDRSVRIHLGGVFLFTPAAGRSTFGLSSVFYQMLTPRRDVVLLDQFMTNSPLTVDGTIVRGLHFRLGAFFFHAGYASLTTFENFILPSRKEGVIGMGYRFSLGDHASLMPNFYFFPGRQPSENIGQRGTVTSLVYDYEPGKNLGLLAEAGFSHGVGAAARFHFYGVRDQVTANVRYEPVQFGSLSFNSLHGFYSSADWTRILTPRLSSTLSFTGDHYTLASFDLTNVVSNLNLQLQLSRRWSLVSGVNYGSSKSHIPVGPAISSLGLPVGFSFYSVHFQGSFLYQYSRNSGSLRRSDEFRTTLGTHWSGFHLSGFLDRQTQAPTIGFVLAGVPGLQEALDKLGISATTPEQIALLLRETAGLANQGFLEGVKINLSPVRLQAGTDLTWSNRALSHQEFHFNFLYNRNDFLQGGNQTAIGTLSYSLKFKNVNEFFASLSLLRSNTTGIPGWRTSPLLEISFRRQFVNTPNFIIPRRRGTIRGVVFADDGATGRYHPGGPLLSDVEVVLDDTRRIRTDRNGHYMFPGVSYGLHFVELAYHSASPFFFTTASRVQSDADTEVNFGVGLSSARIFGSVRSDAGIALSGVEISISKGPLHFSAQTDVEGKFRIEGLSPDVYEVNLDMNSVPPGYSLAESATQRTAVEASAPARIAFTLRAIRNISGRVTIYDRASHQDIPVPGITVLLREFARVCVTDENGFYLFRELSAGSYSLVVVYQGNEFKRDVVLPDAPAFLKDIEINLGTK
jgi:hypothetical protein